MSRLAVPSIVLLTGALIILPSAGAASAATCAYSKKHPAPVKVSDLPARVIEGRTQVVRVIPRTSRSGKLSNRRLTSLSIAFEELGDNVETFRRDLLSSYKKTRTRNRNIGYDVVLEAQSPGERAIVRWHDADPKLPSAPCDAEVRTRDMALAPDSARAKPRITSRSGASDVRKRDSAVLNISGRRKGCPLTDPAALTVTATSGKTRRTLRLDMACGFWASGGTTVRGFSLLSADGDYAGAAKLFVSPRKGPKAGSKLTIVVRKGRTVLKTKRFQARRVNGRRARRRALSRGGGLWRSGGVPPGGPSSDPAGSPGQCPCSS